MLNSIKLSDFVLVPELHLTVRKGLTTLTGETGAGKSLLFDALLLAAGERAEPSLVRVGAERAEVEVEFALGAGSAALLWLREQELDDETRCVMRRVIRAEGGSRCFINGRSVAVGQARELAERLLEVHGQHAFQRLLERPAQLSLLDGFCQHEDLLHAVRQAAERLKALRERREILQALAGQSGDLLIFKRQQLAELEALAPSAEKLSAADARQRRLNHAGALMQGLAQQADRLGGEQGSASRQIRLAEQDLARLVAFDPALGEPIGRLESLRLELEDLSGWLQQRAEELDLDPVELQRAEAELARYHDMARKLRVPVQSLPARLESLRCELSVAEGAEAELGELQRSEQLELTSYRASANKLTVSRNRGAARLAHAVVNTLRELGMAHAELKLEFPPREGEPSVLGAEACEWMFSANPGQTARPLRKIASGGELSRLALAVKLATVAQQDVPVLLFDEVDAGIGGATAAVVGRKLQLLAEHRQVLTITHSPQVACFGDQQLRVRKEVRKGATWSRIDELDAEQRRDELARMLGGETALASSLSHAHEMLQAALRKRA